MCNLEYQAGKKQKNSEQNSNLEYKPVRCNGCCCHKIQYFNSYAIVQITPMAYSVAADTIIII